MGVQLITIAIAALSSVILAFIWYHPMLFGGAFSRMLNLTPEQHEAGKRKMLRNVLFAFLGSLLVAYVMSYMLPIFVYPDWIGAIELACWIWIGFVAPILLGSVLWEQRPFKLYLINAFFWLAALLLMSFILLESSLLFSGGAIAAYPSQGDVYLNE